MTQQKNFFTYIFGTTWRVWDFLCRVVINLVITVLVVFVVAASLSSKRVIFPSNAALVVDMKGDLVEQYSGDPAARAMSRLLGQKQQPQTRLRDVVGAIEKAKDDSRIKALVLETDELDSAGLAALREIGHAIQDFRSSGKPVFALGSAYDQRQYYLAAQADTVFIHPQGEVFLHGFGIYQPYFKDAIDKLGIEWNIFRVGKYKSAVEPFMLNGMSPEAREDYSGVLKSLWGVYEQDITHARKLPADALDAYIAGAEKNLEAEQGDTAKLALKSRLVDKIAQPDQMIAAVAKVTGWSGHSFRQIEYRNYLGGEDGDPDAPVLDGDKVAVIVASGDIMPGDQPPGAIGGDSTSELIRQARDDDSVKAVVLRVDSPGGSSFASDLILRQLELVKDEGKPVVVSMGSVAASGGYWISMAADEIYASPATITGSIGIFGMLPTFQKTLAKIGVHSDGVGTSPLSDAFDLTRSMSPEMKHLFQLSIDHGYQEFITKVARNRHMKVDAVDAIAQGRVWAGGDAKRIGLVDKFGGLDDAVEEAAKLADIEKSYSVGYVEKPLSFTDRLLVNLANSSGDSSLGMKIPEVTVGPWYGKLMRLAQSLDVFDDPRGIYAYCFCSNVR